MKTNTIIEYKQHATEIVQLASTEAVAKARLASTRRSLKIADGFDESGRIKA